MAAEHSISERPTRRIILIELVGLAVVIAGIIYRAPQSDWNLPLFFILLGFSIFSDLTAVTTTSKFKVSGSFLALVLAMVFLGGSAAAVIGIATILVGWARWRDAGHYLLNNVLTYATFPLVCGVIFAEVVAAADIADSQPMFYALVFGVFLLGMVINFALIVSYACYLAQSSFLDKVRTSLVPVLPSEVAAALMAAGIAFLYVKAGIAAVALFGVVLVTYQYLIGALLLSQQRAEELEERSTQLASFQVGMLSALLRTLDLRDHMTARHSASVARYSRAIAQRAGFSRREQELVHVAALLHDIGKFILPDRILKANVSLSEEDWMLIRRHPQQGARVVSAVDGYGPVAGIILAHHERIDGTGYPRGLAGDEIPAMARIISVADTYDVMTARDSYRDPVSTFDAIQELHAVSGSQLDARFVKIFVDLLEDEDIDFPHGPAVDFERELALQARIEDFASPSDDADPLPRVPDLEAFIRTKS